MNRISTLILCCLAAIPMYAQWTTLSRTTADGGEIPVKVNNMQICDGKLYAATTDGIWESPSMTGGDWKAYGLQGEEVLLMNLDEYKLAVIYTKSPTDTNKDGTPANAGQVYKRDDNGTWVATNFNSEKKKSFHPVSGFVQIKDDKGTPVIVVPTWGSGIWRSEDGGETWTQSELLPDPFDETLLICKTVVGLFTFPGDNTIYGTDKAGNDDNYLIRSHDYGKTWEFAWIGQFFNPWAFCKRTINGVETFYFGGENGSNGYAVMTSIEGGAEGTWEPCNTTDEIGTYWHNRYMLGRDEGPLFVMLAQTGVFLFKDGDKTLEKVGDNLQITNANKLSLTHMVMTDNTLYCSSQEDFIQTFNIEGLGAIEQVKADAAEIQYADRKLSVTSDKNSTVFIYSITGMLVMSVDATKAQIQVDLKDLASGIYVVEYQYNGARYANKLVVR